MNYRKTNSKEAEMVACKRELTEKPQLLVLDWTNKFFEIWEKYALKFSSDKHFMLASVIVKDDKIIWIWTNSSDYHEKYWCRRKDEKWKSLYKSGEKYELCPWCNPKTAHSEPLAIKNIFVFNFLESFKDNKKILEKYSKQIKKLDFWIFETNFIWDIDDKEIFEEFLENIKEIVWEKEFEEKYKQIVDLIKDSTIFLYWHFWACHSCWHYSKDFWIKNVIVQKKVFDENKKR